MYLHCEKYPKTNTFNFPFVSCPFLTSGLYALTRLHNFRKAKHTYATFNPSKHESSNVLLPQTSPQKSRSAWLLTTYRCCGLVCKGFSLVEQSLLSSTTCLVLFFFFQQVSKSPMCNWLLLGSHFSSHSKLTAVRGGHCQQFKAQYCWCSQGKPSGGSSELFAVVFNIHVLALMLLQWVSYEKYI